MSIAIYDYNTVSGRSSCFDVRLTQQKALLVYGPLSWVNSTAEQLYNRDYENGHRMNELIKNLKIYNFSYYTYGRLCSNTRIIPYNFNRYLSL